MKRLSAILDFVLVFGTVAIVLSGCGVSTGVAYKETTETLDANGAVTGRETVEVERKSNAINSKVELKDLQSTLAYSPINGLSSGLSTSDFQGSPETKAFDTIERSLALWRGMQVSQESGTAEKLSPLEEVLLLRVLEPEAQPPAISDEDQELLKELPKLREEMAAILEAIKDATPTEE